MAAPAATEREAKKAVVAQLPSDREIVQVRVFDAPRELVWKAWTDPRHADQWWGPNGFRNQTQSIDFRVGGRWRFLMHGPDGKTWVNWIRYEEISQPERLVYAHGGEGDEPVFHVTVTFADRGGRTEVTMRSLFPSVEACEAVKQFGAVAGGAQTLARLGGYLPHLADGSADDAMVLSRLLDAPARRVFEAWSKPELLARYPFHGAYREIIPNQRIAFSAVIGPGVEVMTTVTFAEEDGKTLLTVRQSIPTESPEAAKGQREGWNGTLEKLAAALASRG
jgi:uncharacterized protein YndB with AHSA1/START domain